MYPVPRPLTREVIEKILKDHGFTPNPLHLVSPFNCDFVSDGEGLAWYDVGPDAVRKGDIVPDRPVRITFSKGLSGWEVKSVEELKAGVSSKYADRHPDTPKISPWPKPGQS